MWEMFILQVLLSSFELNCFSRTLSPPPQFFVLVCSVGLSQKFACGLKNEFGLVLAMASLKNSVPIRTRVCEHLLQTAVLGWLTCPWYHRLNLIATMKAYWWTAQVIFSFWYAWQKLNYFTSDLLFWKGDLQSWWIPFVTDSWKLELFSSQIAHKDFSAEMHNINECKVTFSCSLKH